MLHETLIKSGLMAKHLSHRFTWQEFSYDKVLTLPIRLSIWKLTLNVILYSLNFFNFNWLF